MITRKSLKNVSEMIDALTKEQYDQAIRSLFDAQSAVLEFLVGLTEGRIQAQAISLSFCVFKAYQAEHPGKAVTVKREDFQVVFDQAKTWIAQLGSPDLDDTPYETEPFLLTYIIECLTTPHEDGSRLSAVEQHDILLLVKTVMLALDHAMRRSAEGT